MIYGVFPLGLVQLTETRRRGATGLEVQVGTMPRGPGIWVLEGVRARDAP